MLASGAVAARARRRAAAAPASTAVALPPRAHRVATEVFDGRVARLAGPAVSAPAAGALSPAAGRTVAQRLAAQRAADQAAVDAVDHELAGRADDGWTPVEVPSPVYASKPVSHRPPTLPWSMPPAAPVDDAPEAADAGVGPAGDARHEAHHEPQHEVEHEVEQERRSASA